MLLSFFKAHTYIYILSKSCRVLLSGPYIHVHDHTYIHCHQNFSESHSVYTYLNSVPQLRQERDRSMSESSQLEEQVLALKQAVQEQEAELRTSQEKMETDRRERDMDDKQRQGRAQDEVRAARGEGEREGGRTSTYIRMREGFFYEPEIRARSEKRVIHVCTHIDGGR